MANFGRRNLGPRRGNSRDLSPQGPFSGDLSRSKKNPDRGSGFLRGFAAGRNRRATVSAGGRRGGAAARVRASGCRAALIRRPARRSASEPHLRRSPPRRSAYSHPPRQEEEGNGTSTICTFRSSDTFSTRHPQKPL